MIHLIRHGETEWSRARRHTGRTDVPLTAAGRAQATALGPLVRALDPAVVLTSPLHRAIDTAALAGLQPSQVDGRLAEWDYGQAEGRTTEDVRRDVPGWSVWTHSMPGAETLDQVAARVDSLLADLRSTHPVDTVVLVGHAHLFRILAARWCGLPPVTGQHLALDPASLSTLGHERDTPCILGWNRTA